jgi:hypothetical protein
LAEPLLRHIRRYGLLQHERVIDRDLRDVLDAGRRDPVDHERIVQPGGKVTATILQAGIG